MVQNKVKSNLTVGSYSYLSSFHIEDGVTVSSCEKAIKADRVKNTSEKVNTIRQIIKVTLFAWTFKYPWCLSIFKKWVTFCDFFFYL